MNSSVVFCHYTIRGIVLYTWYSVVTVATTPKKRLKQPPLRYGVHNLPIKPTPLSARYKKSSAHPSAAPRTEQYCRRASELSKASGQTRVCPPLLLHKHRHNAAAHPGAAPAPAGHAGGDASGIGRLRGREVPRGAGVRGVRGPPEAGRVAALDVRRGKELPVRGVRGGAGGGRRVGGVGAEPDGRGHGRRAGAGGAGGVRVRLRGAHRADVQHHGVRPAGERLDAAGLPGHRPRRGRRSRGQDPGVRHAAAARGDEGREPGVAGRRVIHRRRPRQARVPAGQPRRQEQARPRRQVPRGGVPVARPRASCVRRRRGVVQVPQRRRGRGRRGRAGSPRARAGGILGDGMMTRPRWLDGWAVSRGGSIIALFSLFLVRFSGLF
jgi:hypothetical protein